MTVNWNDILLAFLHDPPDKALGIKDHVDRACRYASAATGIDISRDAFIKHADHVASAVERLPMPTAGENAKRAVSPENGQLTVVHPLSGDSQQLVVGNIDEDQILSVIRNIVKGLTQPTDRFLALWRQLGDQLAHNHTWFARLPADTRTPDHTIWNHLDITAGLHAALSGPHSAAFLSFAIGPVQGFIASARSVRDLWSGSMILSWLTFRAMLPIIEELGPTALIYPSLRGIPLVDLWMQNRPPFRERMGELSPDLRMAPCLPNRFLAIVPWGRDGTEGQRLAELCETRALTAWKELANSVRGRLAETFDKLPFGNGWDSRWDEQITDFFDVRTAVLPWKDATDNTLASLLAGLEQFDKAFPEAAKVRQLVEVMPDDDCPSYLKKSNPSRGDLNGVWQARLELSSRLMEAERAIRKVPAATEEGLVPPKCSLLGSYEQMGPARLDESRQFWDAAVAAIRERTIDGVRLAPRERFCAVALVKRFCGPAFFVKELQLQDPRDLRFPDTASIAAAKWLEDAKIDPDKVREAHRSEGWSGQWLHWPTAQFDKDDEKCPDDVFARIVQGREKHGKPPAYYAILMMDGDDMGAWLRGDKSPIVEKVMHPKIRQEYFDQLKNRGVVTEALNARRPVGPALHAAISEALANFALHVVPAIVEKHQGRLIYAGGDDVIALLPTRTALTCALELRRAFSGEIPVNQGADRGYYRANGRDLLMLGPTATLSAGLAIVHYKEDLRFALEQARRAEKEAKTAGRNALQINACRRSGEHASALCPWDYVNRVAGWVTAFQNKASDRWAYHLRAELPTLQGLDKSAMRAEIRRQVERSEKATREQLLAAVGDQQPADSAGELLARAFDDYCNAVVNSNRNFTASRTLESFITLCQTASFLARGRDA